MPHAAAIVKAFERAEGVRHNWEFHWQRVANFVLPTRQFTFKFTGGERRNLQIFDATAVQASAFLANALHGMLVNPEAPWFSLRMQDDDLNDIRPVKDWLQDTARRMFSVFNSKGFGFNTQIHEVFTDLSAFGTSAMILTAQNGRIRFQALPLQEIYIEIDDEGKIRAVYRKFELTVRQAFERWGAAAGPAVASIARGGGNPDAPDTKRMYLNAVFPRDQFDPSKLTTINMPTASVTIDLKEKVTVSESGFRRWPYLTPRWKVAPSETYGRSQAMEILPEIGMVNAMSKTIIVAAEKAVDPPLQVPANSIEGPIRTRPGGITYRRSGSSDKIEPINTGVNIGLGIEYLEQRREDIRKAFFMDILGPLPERDRMTTVEIMQRVRQSQRIMSPIIARINSELLDPLISTTFGIMDDLGMIDDPPPEAAGQMIDIDFVSPLALSQKASEIDNISQWLGVVEPLAQFDPGLAAVINTEGIARFSHKLLNAPTIAIRSEDDVAQIKQAQQEREDQAAQAAINKDQAAAAESGAAAFSEIAGIG